MLEWNGILLSPGNGPGNWGCFRHMGAKPLLSLIPVSLSPALCFPSQDYSFPWLKLAVLDVLTHEKRILHPLLRLLLYQPQLVSSLQWLIVSPKWDNVMPYLRSCHQQTPHPQPDLVVFLILHAPTRGPNRCTYTLQKFTFVNECQHVCLSYYTNNSTIISLHLESTWHMANPPPSIAIE